MSNDLHAVWERYVSSWQQPSPEKRREIFEACLAPTCEYSDPLGSLHGWEELSRYMLGLQQQVPGVRFVTERFFARGGRSVAGWSMLNGSGAKLSEGISYAEYDDARRLTRMEAFFDLPASPPPA